MAYTPPDEILKKYARVLVHFAANRGKGLKKGQVVRLSVPDSAKPLFLAVHNEIIEAGGHVISNFIPQSVGTRSVAREYFERVTPAQIKWFPEKYVRGLVDVIDQSISIIADDDPHELNGIDPKKIMQRGVAWKPMRDMIQDKEYKNKFSWVGALYGTPGMAKEAGLSEEEYWDQIIKACFLDEKDPVKKWREVFNEINAYCKKLNKITLKTDRLHITGADVDLWITPGEKRQWLVSRGHNIPSFEIFTSPDWRGTEGWIRFNQPLYRYGNKITGIQLWFKKGRVVKSSAETNEKVLKEMIATPGADKIGEYSLTDGRHSRITKFMAETLYDENMGGPEGNTHLALGMPYLDSYTGDPSKLTKKSKEKLGYNDSSVHTDIISTTKRTVTAHLKDGTEKVIYKDGQFVL
jgi:aminopeptidase